MFPLACKKNLIDTFGRDLEQSSSRKKKPRLYNKTYELVLLKSKFGGIAYPLNSVLCLLLVSLEWLAKNLPIFQKELVI